MDAASPGPEVRLSSNEPASDGSDAKRPSNSSAAPAPRPLCEAGLAMARVLPRLVRGMRLPSDVVSPL